MNGLIKLTGNFTKPEIDITRLIQDSSPDTADVEVIIVHTPNASVVLCEVYDVYRFFSRGFAEHLHKNLEQPIRLFNHGSELDHYPTNRR